MKVIYKNDEIQERIKLLAKKLNQVYSNKELTIVYFLNSASFFVIDLIKYLKFKVEIIPIAFKNNPKNNPPVLITMDVSESIKDKNVLLLEGMIISGNTPNYLLKYFKNKKPKTIDICCIGIKSKFFKNYFDLKYFLFDFNNEMVVGYGIGDSSEKSSLNLIDKNFIK